MTTLLFVESYVAEELSVRPVLNTTSDPKLILFQLIVPTIAVPYELLS